jgi:hypothetical protein
MPKFGQPLSFAPALSHLFAIRSTLAPSVPCWITRMLKITLHDSAAEFRFHLEGRLSGPWVDELRQCWQTAASTTEGRSTVLDLHEVDFIDPAGQKLLSDMHAAGIRFVADTPLIQAFVEEACPGCECGTVEGKLARNTNAFLRSHASGHHPRTA